MKRDLVIIGHPMASSSAEELNLLHYLMRNRNILWVNHSQTQDRRDATARALPLPLAPKHATLHEFSPHALLPSRINWCNGINHYWLKVQVEHAMRREQIQLPILWVNTVKGIELADTLRGHKVIYFCNENAPEWPNTERQLWLQRQSKLIAKADLILATEEAEINRLPPHKTCLLNAPQPLNNTRAPRPKDLPRGRPIAGFYGSLDDRIDWSLLAHAARSRPDWHWVLIGPNRSKQLADVLRYKNIFWLGEKNYEALSTYLPHWQLLLLPYVTTASRQPYHSLKQNEYLAQDKPVVMTPPLPQESGFRPLVSRIHNANELAELLPVHFFNPQEPDMSTPTTGYAWHSLLASPNNKIRSETSINWEQQAATLAGLLDADSKP